MCVFLPRLERHQFRMSIVLRPNERVLLSECLLSQLAGTGFQGSPISHGTGLSCLYQSHTVKYLRTDLKISELTACEVVIKGIRDFG